jgi:hypothetical protein
MLDPRRPVTGIALPLPFYHTFRVGTYGSVSVKIIIDIMQFVVTIAIIF